MIVALAILAGGIGAVSRHLVDQRLGQTIWRWSTLGVNITGSLGIGIGVSAVQSNDLFLIVGAGFFGGFTTFSTASVIAAQAIVDRKSPVAAVHTVLVATACVAAAASGNLLGRAL